MSEARVLAFAAAGAGVFGAWELLAAIERARVTAWLTRTIAPLRSSEAPAASERRRLVALAAEVSGAAGWLLGGPLLGVLAGATAPAAVAAVFRHRRARHARAVQAGAAAAARAIAAGLSSGRSIRGALAETNLEGPAGAELRRAAHALQIGQATEPVLEGLRRRAGGGPWDTLVAALLIQRDAGGDLAGLLRGLAASLEAAARADRDAHAATAQSRATAWMVGGLPVAAAALAELASPGFLLGLLTTPISGALAGLAAVLQVVAIVCIRRLTR